MAVHLTAHRPGFALGRTAISTFDEPDSTGIALSVWKLRCGERVEETLARETAFLLMSGELELAPSTVLRRASLFDDLPSALRAGAGASIVLSALTDVELTVYETKNTHALPARIYLPKDVRDELRGKGLVKNTALRFVRTIFDRENAHPDAELVLGEVVNLPGR